MSEYVEQVQPRRVVATIENTSALGGSSAVYATRVDTASTPSVTYVGKALPGTATSAASWQIQKIDESGTPETTVITFADGNADFDNIWDNRTSLSYS